MIATLCKLAWLDCRCPECTRKPQTVCKSPKFVTVLTCCGLCRVGKLVEVCIERVRLCVKAANLLHLTCHFISLAFKPYLRLLTSILLAKARTMDPAITGARLRDGGFVVMHGAPKGTLVGIDTASWAATDDFCGFKMIPPGVHFVTFGCVQVSQFPQLDPFECVSHAS